jgi:hypothetical protein
MSDHLNTIAGYLDEHRGVPRTKPRRARKRRAEPPVAPRA